MPDIFIPQLSENLTSGTVIGIGVKLGDKVTKGQTLLELETEKAVLEIPSPADGTITDILVKAGDVVKVGHLVFRIAPKDDRKAVASPSTTQGKTSYPLPSNVTPVPPKAENKPAEPSTTKPIMNAPHSDEDIPAAPSVRRLAREIGVNLAEVSGTGPHGHITDEDVKNHAKNSNHNPASSPSTATVPSADQLLPNFSKWGEITVEPMSSIRRKTAEHMAIAWATIPHVTHFAKVDITELDKLRVQYSTEERKLSILPFIMKIVAAGLKHLPRLNSSVNPVKNEIIYKKYCHIGIAVDTEHGLLVPVIRNVDKKGILELADELKTLSERARNRKLLIEEMQGGTFTITNLGSITGGFFTPIINSPEVAILGLARAEFEPHCPSPGGQVCAPRLLLPLSLSYDHRAVDGAEAARFIKWISDAIQQPLMLEL